MPTKQEIINYIIQSAQARGIDPNTAVKVWAHEGKGAKDYQSGVYNKAGLREPSYGPFQLLVGGKGTGFPAGLGNRAPFNARDPNTWRENIDFALDTAKKDGWRQWYGAKNAGINRWGGIQRDYNPDNIRPPAEIRTAAPKSIDIGDKPTLAALTPQYSSKDTSSRAKDQPTIPLAQLAPTEASSTMARHPSYEESIKQAMDENPRGSIKVAGLALPPIRPPGSGGKFRANPMAPSVKYDRLPKPEDVPGPRTPTVAQQEQRARMEQIEREAQKARVQRGENPSPTVGSGPTINAGPPQPGSTAPIVPNKVKSQSITPEGKAAGAALGATAGTTAIGVGVPGAPDPNDKDLKAVMDTVQGGIDPMTGMPMSAPPVSPRTRTPPTGDPPLTDGPQVPTFDPMTGMPMSAPPIREAAPPPYNPKPGMNPNDVAGPLMEKMVPAMKEAVKDPAVRQAMKVVAGGVTKAAAQRDAMKADMQADPTYYQRTASQRQPQQMPNDPNNPLAERQMMDAVARDYQNPRMVERQQQQMPQRPQRPPMPPRAAPVVAQGPSPKDQSQVPTTEQQIVAQATGQPRWLGYTADGPRDQMANNAPPMEGPPSLGPQQMSPQPMTNPPQQLDPVMMQLMQFFGSGNAP